jgi:hypothetical protein
MTHSITIPSLQLGPCLLLPKQHRGSVSKEEGGVLLGNSASHSWAAARQETLSVSCSWEVSGGRSQGWGHTLCV